MTESEVTKTIKGEPKDGIALCLSGGGYRAMLFHAGALWRLNELGYLRKLTRVSSVSGGSIIAAFLGLKWGQLSFDAEGVAANFEATVVDPIRVQGERTIDRRAILLGLMTPFVTIPNLVACAYRRLFGKTTLQDLPDESIGQAPRFIINATNVHTGVLWRFSKPYAGDYLLGRIKNPKVLLALAVAASSAFPPFLSPVKVRLNKEQWIPNEGDATSKLRKRVFLTDGGVYDNLGLETAWKRCRTLIVSDGGQKFANENRPWRNWLSHTLRIHWLTDNQVRSLRKRQLIDSFIEGEREGTYFGMRTNIKDYPLNDAWPVDAGRALELANVSTRLKALNDATQERLINFGYALCDAAMRAHVLNGAPRPSQLPYPETGI